MNVVCRSVGDDVCTRYLTGSSHLPLSPAVYLIVCPIPLVPKEDPNRDGAIYINLVKLSASRQCLRSCYALAVGTNPGSKIFLDRQNLLRHVISQQMALLQR